MYHIWKEFHKEHNIFIYTLAQNYTIWCLKISLEVDFFSIPQSDCCNGTWIVTKKVSNILLNNILTSFKVNKKNRYTGHKVGCVPDKKNLKVIIPILKNIYPLN